MSGEPISVSHDPNYKWRVLGSISIVFITACAVTTTAIFSEALSGGTIIGLFGILFAIVQIVILLVLRYPSANQRWYDMHNPLAVPFSLLTSFLASLFVKYLGTK